MEFRHGIRTEIGGTVTKSDRTIEVAVEDITMPRTLNYVPRELGSDSSIALITMQLQADAAMSALVEVSQGIRAADNTEDLFGALASIMGLDPSYVFEELRVFADNVINIPDGTTNLIPASQVREWAANMVARMVIGAVADSKGWDTIPVTVSRTKVAAYIKYLLSMPPSPERQVQGVIPLLQGGSLILPLFNEDLVGD